MIQFAAITGNQTFSALPMPPGALWIALLLGAAAAAVGLLYLLRPLFHGTSRFSPKNVRSLVLVQVPQETGDETPGDARIDAVREQIAAAEALFGAIGGLRAQRGLLAWLRGRTDHFSFEIVAHKDEIAFYVAVSQEMLPYLEEQVHAQYPDALLEVVPSYNLFSPTGKIAGANLMLTKHHAFTLKTYKTMETDSLGALTNALAGLEEGDSACIQLTVRSARGEWRTHGTRLAKPAKEGKGISAKKQSLVGSLGKELLKSATKSTSQDGKPPEIKQLTQMEEEQVRAIEEKASKAGLDVNIRIIVSSNDGLRTKRYLDNIVNAFSQFSGYQFGNAFRAAVPSKPDRLIRDFIYRSFDEGHSMVLNTEELASLYHFPLPTMDTPGIKWLASRTSAPPVSVPKEGIFLGTSDYRGEEIPVHMKRGDRRRHFYIIGKSGTGKSVWLKNMVKQDIESGEGVCVIDPHGDFAEFALSWVPEKRIDDVIYFNPSDMERPMGLNMLEAKNDDEKDFLVQEMISIFYQLFSAEMIGPMFEHYMRNVMLTLMADMENPGTVAEIPRMFTDEQYSAAWVKKLKDPVVRAFWEKEMSQMTPQTRSDMLGYLISKVGRFVENEMLRNIIGQQHSAFDFRDVMDSQKILIVNLAKGKTGEVNANLIGMILVAKLQMAVMGRTDIGEEERKDFLLYMDEFQNFITPSIGTILSEARKYRLDLIMAHQYLGQLAEGGDTKTRDAVLGNAGTICCYRIGPEDSEILAKEFAPTFTAHDLMNPPEFNAYLKLLVDGKAIKPFNCKAKYWKEGNPEMAEGIKKLSQLKYGRDRRLVEAEIMERAQLGSANPVAEPEHAASPL